MSAFCFLWIRENRILTHMFFFPGLLLNAIFLHVICRGVFPSAGGIERVTPPPDSLWPLYCFEVRLRWWAWRCMFCNIQRRLARPSCWARNSSNLYWTIQIQCSRYLRRAHIYIYISIYINHNYRATGPPPSSIVNIVFDSRDTFLYF